MATLFKHPMLAVTLSLLSWQAVPLAQEQVTVVRRNGGGR